MIRLLARVPVCFGVEVSRRLAFFGGGSRIFRWFKEGVPFHLEEGVGCFFLLKQSEREGGRLNLRFVRRLKGNSRIPMGIPRRGQDANFIHANGGEQLKVIKR